MPQRDTYIPTTKSDLARALTDTGRLNENDAARFTELCRVLGAVFHYETFDELERLKALYRPFDPSEPASDGGNRGAFIEELRKVLTMAGFEEFRANDIIAAAAVETLADLKVRTQEAGIERIRFFVRGARPATLEFRRFWGLIKRKVESSVYDDIVVTIKLPAMIDPKGAKTLERIRRGVRPGAVLLRHFADVPREDLVTLHPGAAPAMKRRDQLILGVPAIAGGLPLLAQIGPAIAVLAAVLAGYLGIEHGQLTDSSLKRAIAAISGVVALGAFLMRQRLKFDRQRLFYQKQLADTVYFHTVSNNAGVLDGLVGAAEEQDVKEAMLCYHTLLTDGPMTKTALDSAVETFLRDKFAMDVDFEIGDALAKLERLKLLQTSGDILSAVPLEDALARLDEAWDNYFCYRKASA